MNKAPMNFYEFKKHLDIIDADMLYLDKCYDIGLDMYNKINSIYNSIQLLTIIFKDKMNLIEQWLFETEYSIVDSVEDLYDLLVKGYNTWLKEECLPSR